ncbi:MAG TPA: polymer-forming cytoskeletal protein [Gemmatimonadaceae bacterium]|nr:polymer-forming cytoskeletal protein [Gemmatimonadaceae bacterium]
MRALVRRVALNTTLVAPLLALPAGAQSPSRSKTVAPAAADSARPAPSAEVGRAPATLAPDSVARLVALVRSDPGALPLPAADSFTVGNRVVPAGQESVGPVAVVHGDIDVFGTVAGDAIAIAGDVVVHPGGRVRGNALAAMGSVRAEGGTVDGEMRSLKGPVGAVTRPAARTAQAVALSPAAATYLALKLSLGWTVMLALIGIGVLLFAERYLEGVVDTIEDAFSRALWVGIAGEIALLPALLVLVVALAITLVGILLIPFGVFAFALAAAGLATLGFLAVAQVTGSALLRGRARAALTERGESLRALVTGVVLYTGLWVIAAAFTWSPIIGGVLRGLAFAVCWVAVTVGFGAALLSRAGTRRTIASPAARVLTSAPSVPAAPPDWQTPTPVAGVVAARRPTPAPMKETR